MSKISNPRRILLVGASGSGKLTFLKSLTGSLPVNIGTSHAGLSHEVQLKTPYYAATVPIWVDEVPTAAKGGGEANKDEPKKDDGQGEAEEADGDDDDGEATLESWTQTYLSPAAEEVLSVLGGIILTFRASPPPLAELSALRKITRKMGCNWDGVLLAVSMTAQTEAQREETEDACLRCGFEPVDFAHGKRGARNEYGEVVGMERVKEALEANDWTGEILGYDEEEGEGLKKVGDEMESEMFGLHHAIFTEGGEGGEGEGEEGEGEGEEIQVEQLEAAMTRLSMLRDMGDEVSKEERKKIAAKAIADIIKS